MRIMIRLLAMAATTLWFMQSALAYIGPGAGLSVLAAFWTLLTAIVASILFLVLWPLRQWLRRRRDGAHRQPFTGTQDKAGAANAQMTGKDRHEAKPDKAPINSGS